MAMFNKVLFLSNPSINQDASLHQLKQLLKQTEASVVLMEVIKPPRGFFWLGESQQDSKTLETSLRRNAFQALEGLAEDIRALGVDVDIHVAVGKDYVEVIRAALNQAIDLVMLSASSDSGIKEQLFGSTAMHLIRKCPCPVWAVRPAKGPAPRKLMAAVDLDPDQHDQSRRSLNPRILEMGSVLAESLHMNLLVGQAWQLDNENYLEVRGGLSEENLNRLRKDAHRQYTAMLEGFCAQQLGDNHQAKVLLEHGPAAPVIKGFVDKYEIDLLIMGTISRQGILGMLIGNTAEELLHQADCSVLALKPEGFVCPLALD